jgi:acetyl esterase/lipase
LSRGSGQWLHRGQPAEGAGARVVSVAYPLSPFPQPLETGYAVLQWAYKQRTRLAGAGARCTWPVKRPAAIWRPVWP